MHHMPPPPLFKQGPSALVRFVAFSFFALTLLILDARLSFLDQIRQVVSVGLYPIQRTLQLPVDAWARFSNYTLAQETLRQETERLERERIELAQSVARAQRLEVENTQLRLLLGAQPQVSTPSMLVEVLYELRDGFYHRLVIDKGASSGISPGMPLIDDKGVAGQVVRTAMFTSEVALITDEKQSIPVQVVRTGMRGVLFGGEEKGLLALRFVGDEADIQVGDLFVTSGLDGLYPAGLPVASIIEVKKNPASSFIDVRAQPVSSFNNYQHFLVLQTVAPELPDLPISALLRKRLNTRENQ